MSKFVSHPDADISFLVSKQREQHMQFRTKNEMFSSHFKYFIYEDRILLMRATLGDIKAKKAIYHGNSYQFVLACQIPEGRYYFDKDESNEDIKVIYLNEST